MNLLEWWTHQATQGWTKPSSYRRKMAVYYFLYTTGVFFWDNILKKITNNAFVLWHTNEKQHKKQIVMIECGKPCCSVGKQITFTFSLLETACLTSLDRERRLASFSAWNELHLTRLCKTFRRSGKQDMLRERNFMNTSQRTRLPLWERLTTVVWSMCGLVGWTVAQGCSKTRGGTVLSCLGQRWIQASPDVQH